MYHLRAAVSVGQDSNALDCVGTGGSQSKDAQNEGSEQAFGDRGNRKMEIKGT